MLRPALAAMLLLTSAHAAAADIQSLEVSREGARYRVDLHAVLEVPAAAAFAVFADAAKLPQINPAVKQVQVIAQLPGGGTRLFTSVHVCVLWYCRDLRQVQDMRYAPRADGGSMHADMLPLQGDFRDGRADWEFRATGSKTRLHFQAELEPAFWIPPLIGPWLVQRSLRDEAQRTSAGIEQLAAARASP